MPKISIKYYVLSIIGMFFALYILHYTYFIKPVFAQVNLDSINQKVCDRFEEDVARMAAIMEEYRDRQGIKETRVAFGGIDTKIKSADYWITYAAEAIAFQRAKKPASVSGLKSNLQVLAGKVIRAKQEVGKAIE